MNATALLKEKEGHYIAIPIKHRTFGTVRNRLCHRLNIEHNTMTLASGKDYRQGCRGKKRVGAIQQG